MTTVETTTSAAAPTTPAAVPVTAGQLRGAVEAGSWRQVLDLLGPRTTTELKPLMEELPKLRKEVRELEREDWNGAARRRSALLTAATLCVQTPAQATTWLTDRMMFRWGGGGSGPDYVRLLTVRRDRVWIGELARRLGEKMRQETDQGYWRFVNDLAEAADVGLPINSGYLQGWVNQANWRGYGSAARQLTLLQWLREKPRLQQHIEAIFEFDGLGVELQRGVAGRNVDPDELWPTAIATLAEEGVLGRSALIEAAASRLLRGDRPVSLRGYLKVFEALRPTPAEVRQHYATYTGMAASGASTVAKPALSALRALDVAEPLEPVDLAELSESVLARPESGLANGQLGWIDAALRRDPGTAAILLPCLAAAFTHPAAATQQRALKVLAKHTSGADARTLDGLRDAAQGLDAALRGEAERILGGAPLSSEDPDAPGAVTPAASAAAAPLGLPEYRPTPLPPLPGTPEELLTALAPSFTGGEIGPLEAEQIMAAVAILAHKDRAGLADVFRPFAERHPAGAHGIPAFESRRLPSALRCLLYAVLGGDPRSGRVRPAGDDPAPNLVTVLRIQELADHLLHVGTVPLLLATPTEASGAVDHAILAERAATYRVQGIKALPYDLEQARIRAGGRPELQGELDALADAEVGLRPSAEPPCAQRGSFDIRDLVGSTLPKLRLNTAKITAAQVLYPPLTRDGKPRFPRQHMGWRADHQSSYWFALLPHDPDVVAVHAMYGLNLLANGEFGESETIFPSLAETAGRPGPASHLALAYGLAADRLEHRIAAQDALLVLAARGLLRPEQLGVSAAELWLRGMIKGKRLIDSLVRCEQAGAAADVLGVTAAVVARLADRPDTRGLPDLLLLATRCVAGSGVHGARFPDLRVLAALPKPKRVAAEARRLAQALTSAGAGVREAPGAPTE